MADDKYVVDGFRFQTKEEAAEAKNEYEGVNYMKSRTNMNNPENVYSVYKSLVEKNVFKTPVGMKFLYELKEALYKSGNYSKEEIDGIVISVPVRTMNRKMKKRDEKVSRKEIMKGMKELDIESVYRNRFINSLLFNIILIIAIVVIIMIVGNSNNTNILNYKNRLDVEYSEREDDLIQWQKELDDREKAIDMREKELGNEPTDEWN